MKKKLFLIGLSAILFACSSSEKGGNQFETIPSKWVVETIKTWDEPNTCSYRLIPIDNGILNQSDTWIIDTIGAYEIGDTIIPVKK